MSKRRIALLLAALLLSLSGCAKNAHFEGNPKADILATTQPVYQLACALTDRTGLTVGLLISESVLCLHDYTLTVAQMEMIEQAGVVMESGLGLEDFMEDALSGKKRIVVSSTISTLEAEEGPDPHWWLDPTRFRAAAKLAAQELGTQYPEYADQLSVNLEAFDKKLSELQNYGSEALKDLSCRELVTFHDGFAYFADAFGLDIAAAMEVEAGSEPPARELEEIVLLLRARGIPAVFSEASGSADTAELVAAEDGAGVYTLDMGFGTRDYLTAMRYNLKTVKEALQ